MNDRELIGIEKIDKKKARIVLIPFICFLEIMVFLFAYRTANIYDSVSELDHWLIWGIILLFLSLFFINIYNDATTPTRIYNDGILIHILHINPRAKRFIKFSDIKKMITAEGPKGGFSFYIYTNIGKKYNKTLYIKIINGKVVENNRDIINLIESKIENKFNWITWDEWLITKF